MKTSTVIQKNAYLGASVGGIHSVI